MTNALFDELFVLRYTENYSLLAKTKLHNTEFDSPPNSEEFTSIMSSTHHPLTIYTYICFQGLTCIVTKIERALIIMILFGTGPTADQKPPNCFWHY